tara:strand:- start:462 stop:1127 length:666 start_codon:yes stop_codon:yes gene_type:complete
MFQVTSALALTALLFGLQAQAAPQDQTATSQEANYDEPNFMDSDAYDPADPNIESVLKAYDEYYEEMTGESPWLVNPEFADLLHQVGGCYRNGCPVFINIKKSQQKAYFYLDGRHVGTWDVSTARNPYSTKNWDGHPNGRIYNRYSSSKYPGGDYNGLGNMPYAVFYYGGFALHGTPRGNWKRLGRPASHGCIRMHPDNAKWFNQSVRAAGIKNTWILVEY